MTSKILNVASALLFIDGILGLVWGLRDLTAPVVDEGVLGVTASQIQGFSPKVMTLITHLYQTTGFYLIGFALFFCVISLLPYRRGMKWAWYSMLAIGGLMLFGQEVLAYIAGSAIGSFFIPAGIVLIILWAVGIVLPIKEIFK